ncbi:hypothetical protein ACIQTW_00215 [Paenarthrobacter sp. NPDC090517]|uniref:hypothetical protein n=1 Tax=Paenarthrobacter sp. NPDC090517 TaxID=3364381 RepID=UPI0038182212
MSAVMSCCIGVISTPIATRPTYRWFFRGFEKRFSLPSAFALFSALFSVMVFPDFFDLALLGDFPDIFCSLVLGYDNTIPTYIFKAICRILVFAERSLMLFSSLALAGRAVAC